MKTAYQKKNEKYDRRKNIFIVALSIIDVVGPIIFGIIYTITK